MTGKLFSQDQDKEAIVLEISVPGSNYNAVSLFALDVSPVDSPPIPTSTVRMNTMKGICLNSASDIPNSFDTNIMGSTNIADVDGRDWKYMLWEETKKIYPKSFAGSAEIPGPMMAGRLWKMYRNDDK